VREHRALPSFPASVSGEWVSEAWGVSTPIRFLQSVAATESTGFLSMLGIGEAARRSGVNIETIRYYERRGLIAPPERSDSGRRRFSGDDVARLRFVRRCRDLGFPIEDIAVLLKAAGTGDCECAQVQAVSERQLVTMRERIAELREMEATLVSMLESCRSNGADACPVMDRMLRDPVN